MLDADVEVDRRDFTVRAALSAGPGERLALFGPSGAGKTTVLEAIAGLVPLTRGRITLGGRLLSASPGASGASPGASGSPSVAVPPWQRRTGLLRQDPGLFPHLSVRANLGYARTADRGAALTELAGQLGLDGLLAAMPAQLSGGQQHRVALGRLLLADCDTLLLDEPFSGLDAALRRSLTTLVARLAAERGLPTVLVAHELPDAQAFADRLAVVDRGAVLQTGRPDEVVLRPASRRVAELTGYLAFVPVGDGLVAGVHPDRVTPGGEPSRGVVLAGLVIACRPSGATWEADLQAGPAVVTCRLAGPPPAPGEPLTVTALEPPHFGPDGVALPSVAPDRGV